MSLARRALLRALVVALVTVLALMVAAPTSRRELDPGSTVVTAATAPGSTPVIADIRSTPDE